MALLKIARMGHPILLQTAQPVTDATSPEIRILARDMIETMFDAGGVGLAAPQVYVSLRLFVFRVPAARSGDGLEIGPTVLINPVVEKIGEETMQCVEGCLSIPALRGMVPRAARIRYHGLDLDGNSIAAEATGFHANVIQHEYDHLNGVLYPMRMTDFTSFGFVEEFAKAASGDPA